MSAGRDAVARTLAIVRKELVDTFRDRRSGTVTLLSSILAGPILLILIFNLMARQVDRTLELTLPVKGAEHAPALVAFLERQQVTITQAPGDYENAIRRCDLDVVLVVDDAFAADVRKIVGQIYKRNLDAWAEDEGTFNPAKPAPGKRKGARKPTAKPARRAKPAKARKK